MPLILAFLASFSAAIAPIVVRLLAALGIGFVTYQGVNIAAEAIKSNLTSIFSGIPSDISSLISISGFGIYISLVVSAYVAGVSVRVSMGAFSKFGSTKGVLK